MEGINYEVNDILTVDGGGCRDFVFYITSSVKTPDGKDVILTVIRPKILDGFHEDLLKDSKRELDVVS
uniref:Uncharacterized protein n=1 Tax=Solanum lycopersicum TaxID=4081 RepID=A0A3Q7FNN0_SOLLC